MINKILHSILIACFFGGISSNSVFPLSSGKDKEPSLSDSASVPKIKFYGFIQTHFIFDDSITNDPDATKFVLTENNILNDGQFAATVQNSRLGFDLRGPKVWDGEINGKLEIDFFDKASCNSFRARVRHLYAAFNFTKWNLFLGQTWDVIGPLGPATLNTNGYLWYAGNIGFRRTQARLTYNIELSNKYHPQAQISANRNIGILSGANNTGVD